MIATNSKSSHIKSIWFVYILRCNDGRAYVGCSSKLNKRLDYHKNGYVSYTKSRRPLQLIMYLVFKDKYKAFEFEKYLKSGSARAFTKRHFLKN